MLSLYSGSSNNFVSINEEIHSMPIVWFPPVDSTSDVVYNRREE